MADMARRVVHNRASTAVAQLNHPDAWAIQAASLGLMTNTFSAGSAGVHHPPANGSTPKGFTGDRGYGVNRWAGRTPYPLQNFHAPIGPITDPSVYRLGIGAGVAGQPGLPNTGGHSGGLSSLAWLSYNPLGRAGLGV